MDRRTKLKIWYNKTAHRYETWGVRRGETLLGNREKELQTFKEMLPPLNKKTVLDIGTGTGLYLSELAKYDCLCYGIDISEKMLEETERKFSDQKKRVFLREMDAENLVFPDNFFDFVSCIGVMEYYNYTESLNILKEIWRVLKKGGKAITDFPDALSKEAFLFKEKEKSIGNEVFIRNIDSLNELISKAGFGIIKKSKAGIEIQFLLEKT